MEKDILSKSDKEDLEELLESAKEQGNKINLNLVYMTMKLNENNYDAVMRCFEENGIELIQDDIEPDVTAYSNDRDKARPFDPAKIDITMKPMAMETLLKRINNNEIEFDSSFQRKAGLWSKKQKSQLIESIFLRIPLPAFYFDASDDDNWLIIDGLQRVTTLKQFVIDKTLKLQEMEFFPELNGYNYDQLPRAFQRRIDETVINVYIVNPSTPSNVKFNIFKRINTGGLALEPQEIRNALFQGAATTFLQRCAQSEAFVLATGGSVKSERMLDREFVLRYVSFCYLGLEQYAGNIDEFLNEGMKYLNHAKAEELKQIEDEFYYIMESIYKIMERDAFRKVCSDGRRRPINKVIFESWCYVIKHLSKHEVEQLILNRKAVRRNYMKLCELAEYLYLLKSPDKKAMYARIDELADLLKRLLGEKE